jgi:hypothetical protein
MLLWSKIKDDDACGVCSVLRRHEKCIQNLAGKQTERDHLGDVGVDGRTIKMSLRKTGVKMWTEINLIGKGARADFCKYSDEI